VTSFQATDFIFSLEEHLQDVYRENTGWSWCQLWSFSKKVISQTCLANGKACSLSTKLTKVPYLRPYTGRLITWIVATD